MGYIIHFTALRKLASAFFTSAFNLCL